MTVAPTAPGDAFTPAPQPAFIRGDQRKVFAFRAKHAKAEVREISFELNGKQILCRPVVDGIKALEFSRIQLLLESEDINDQIDIGAGILDFLKSQILNWKTFEAEVKKSGSGVGPSELGEIAGYLMGEYYGRPTV